MFATFQRTNSRQSAVSLLQFSYDLVFNPPRESESSDLSRIPRVYLSRANILMPLLRLMLNRAPKLTARTFYAPLLRFMRERATNL